MYPKHGVRRGILAALALGIACVAPGCDDNKDDPDNLYVVSVVPGDKQTNVLTSSTITLRFSTDVDFATTGSNQILLVDQSNSVQPISLSVGATPEFIIVTPVTPLSPNLTYGVAVREGVKAANGEPIQAPWSMTFATGPTLSTIPGFPPFLTPNPAPPNTGAPGTFTLTGQLVQSRSRHTATRLQSGDVLVTGGATPVRVSAGGTTLRSAELYSPTTGSWRLSNANSQAGMFYARYGHTATLLPSGKVLIAGGWDERAVWDTAELYDPLVDNFAPTSGRMVRSRTFHAATLIGNGNVVMTGGFSDNYLNGILFSMEVYDAPSGTFQLTQNWMRLDRCYHAATLLGNSQDVLITGGITAWGGLGPVAVGLTAACDLFRPDITTSGTVGPVSPTGSLADQRMGHTLTLFTNGITAGFIMAAGGTQGGNTAEIYDPTKSAGGGVTGDWTLVAANMSTNRRAHTANLIENGPDAGQVIMIGGTPTGPTSGVLYTAPHPWASTESHGCTVCAARMTAEKFDPFGYGQNTGAPWLGMDITGRFNLTTDAQSNITTMVGVPANPSGNGGRYYHRAVTLTSGHILVIGGWDCPWCFPAGTQSGPETALQTCELYNP